MNYAAEYGRMHANAKFFPGYSIRPHVQKIAELVRETGAKTLLDYGCGKGRQYSELRVHEAWGVSPALYDVGVPEFSKRPSGKFDGVICTDVLEHIEEADVPAVLSDIFSLAERFVFLSISCAPTKSGGKRKKGKALSDGRDIHVTVRPPEWWARHLKHCPVRLAVAYEDAD